jgi:hypothetical protein
MGDEFRLSVSHRLQGHAEEREGEGRWDDHHRYVSITSFDDLGLLKL